MNGGAIVLGLGSAAALGRAAQSTCGRRDVRSGESFELQVAVAVAAFRHSSVYAQHSNAIPALAA